MDLREILKKKAAAAAIKIQKFVADDRQKSPSKTRKSIELIEEIRRVKRKLKKTEQHAPNPAFMVPVCVNNELEGRPNGPNALGDRDDTATDDDDSSDDEMVEILGARPVKEKLEFEVKRSNGEKQIVNSVVANRKWPHAVIKFYEDRLVFNE